jgi:hypothetical protein
MGYRSDVAYGVRIDNPIAWDESATDEDRNISGDGIFLLMLTEMQQDPIAGKCFGDGIDINEYLTIDKENRSITFYADSLKWYNDYKDVQAHERLYEIMQEYAEEYDNRAGMKHNPISCAFGRIGEEHDDNEYRGSGYDPWSIVNLYRGVELV